MTKDQQASFEAFHIMRAHVARLLDRVDGNLDIPEGSDVYKELAEQSARAQKAVAAYLALPKQQKAA